MRPAAFCGKYRAGDDEELPIIFGRETRRNQRTRPFFRFDDERCMAEARHDAVSLREGIVRRLEIRFEFRKKRAALFDDLAREIHVRARIKDAPIKPRAWNGNSRKTRIKRRFMGLGVNPIRESRYN